MINHGAKSKYKFLPLLFTAVNFVISNYSFADTSNRNLVPYSDYIPHRTAPVSLNDLRAASNIEIPEQLQGVYIGSENDTFKYALYIDENGVYALEDLRYQGVKNYIDVMVGDEGIPHFIEFSRKEARKEHERLKKSKTLFYTHVVKDEKSGLISDIILLKMSGVSGSMDMFPVPDADRKVKLAPLPVKVRSKHQYHLRFNYDQDRELSGLSFKKSNSFFGIFLLPLAFDNSFAHSFLPALKVE